MSRPRKHVLVRGRMNQRIYVIANRLEKTHVSQRASDTASALPLYGFQMVSDAA